MLLKPHRRLEWWLASFTVIWGLFVTFVPDALAGPAFFVVRVWCDGVFWGSGATLVGAVHIWALYINGRRSWSPYVRLGATVASALGFGLVFAGLIAAIWFDISPATLPLVLQYGLLHASLCAFWVAGCDSYSAFKCQQPGTPPNAT